MTTPVPHPPNGQAIQTSRSSCEATRIRANISIPQEGIDAFLSNLSQPRFERLKAQHGVELPVTFASVQSEISFLAVLAVLNTLSAYRAPFHNATGKGAYQNVIRFCVGLYESGGDDAISAEGLGRVRPQDVRSIWGLGEDCPQDMQEPIELVVQCCSETGRALTDAGYETPAQLVLDALADSEGKSDAERAEQFIFKMITTLPAFNDSYILPNGDKVYLFKKAYFLLLSLHQRFQNHPSGPSIPNVLNDALPMFVDNVLPTMCVHLGLLNLSECTEKPLVQWGAAARTVNKDSQVNIIEGPSLTQAQAYIVRAATLDAGSQVVKRARELASQQPERYGWLCDLNEVDLDGYLWSVAKDDPELRRVPRMVEKGTIMY